MAVNIGPRIGIEGEAEYRKSINNIVQTQKTLTAEMQKTESAFGKSANAQAKAAAKSDLLVRKIGEQERHVQKLKVGLEQSAQKFGENDTRTLKWQEALAKAETELNKLNAELDELDRKQSIGQRLQDAGASISGFGQKISTVGDTMTKYISAPIAGVGAVAVKTAMDFEDSMAKVQTIADTTSVPIDDLRGAIMDLSSDTGIAATDIADSVYNAISAGQDTASAVSFVETTAKLAKAGFADTASALDVLTSIMNAYHLEASEAGSVSDKLITVQNRGKTTIAQLSSSMGKVIPTASAFGVSLDNVASAYVVLTKNGISTAESTTYMNSMLNELGKSGTKASEIIKKQTGKSFSELMETGSNVSDVLKILADEADKSNLSLADMFGSAEAGKAALSIMSDGGEEFNASMKAMQESAGATQTAFDTISGTTSEKFKRAMNDLKNTGIRAGTDLITMAGPGIDAFGKKISQISTWYKNLDSDTQRMISTVGVAFAVGGPLLSGVGRLVDGFGKGVSAIGKFLSAASALASPWGAIALGTTAVAGLVLALGDLTKAPPFEGYDEFEAKMRALEDDSRRIQEGFKKASTAIDGIMGSADTEIISVQEKYNMLADCFDSDGRLREGMKQTANYLKDDLAAAFGTDFSGTFSDNMEGNIQILGEVESALDSYIEKIKKAAVEEAYASEIGESVKRHAEAIQAKTTAYNELTTATSELTAAENDFNTIQQELARDAESGVFDFVKYSKADKAREKVEGLSQKVNECGNAYANAAADATQAEAETSGLSEALSLISRGNIDEGAEAMARVGSEAEKAGNQVRNKISKEFENFGSEVKKFASGTLLEEFGKGIQIPELKLPKNIDKSAAQISKELEKQFGKTDLYLDMKKASVGGLAKPIYTTEATMEAGLSRITAKLTGINNVQPVARNANTSITSTLSAIVGNMRGINNVNSSANYALASANSVLSGIVGKVTNIDIWQAAQSAWSELTNYFASNPVWVEVKAKVSKITSGLNIWGWANGGIVDQPTFGVFGEAGPEAFIPLSPSRRGRAMSLYREVGDILGVGAGEGASVYNSTAETTNVGGININVYAQPGQNINQIATEVSRRINAEVFRKGAVYR